MIGACIIAFLAMVVADSMLHHDAKYRALAFIELIMVVAFFICSKVVSLYDNRRFMWLMSFMFGISCLLTTMYWKTEGIPYPVYVQASHGIAIIHVSIMLGASDGLRNLIHYWGRGFNRRSHSR